MKTLAQRLEDLTPARGWYDFGRTVIHRAHNGWIVWRPGVISARETYATAEEAADAACPAEAPDFYPEQVTRSAAVLSVCYSSGEHARYYMRISHYGILCATAKRTGRSLRATFLRFRDRWRREGWIAVERLTRGETAEERHAREVLAPPPVDFIARLKSSLRVEVRP